MENLQDMVFNKWRVESFDKRVENRYYWNCICECGIRKSVRAPLLKNGQSKSCGCYNKEVVSKRQLKDLSNKKFNKLLVIKRVDDYISIDKNTNKVRKRPKWQCLCDCGQTVNVLSQSLLQGLTQSCGCYHTEMMKSRRGENSPSWNPNITNEERIRKRNSIELIEWRTKVYTRDNYTCQITGEKGNVNAHHIYSWGVNKDKRLDINNGITLMRYIHKLFHILYSKGNNTLEQFLEFQNHYKQGKFDYLIRFYLKNKKWPFIKKKAKHKYPPLVFALSTSFI